MSDKTPDSQNEPSSSRCDECSSDKKSDSRKEPPSTGFEECGECEEERKQQQKKQKRLMAGLLTFSCTILFLLTFFRRGSRRWSKC